MPHFKRPADAKPNEFLDKPRSIKEQTELRSTAIESRAPDVFPLLTESEAGVLRGSSIVELPVADHGPDSIVRTKILRALDIQQGAQLGACAVDPALDGADRASADLRRVLVGEP